MEKSYNPKDIEKRWYEIWQKNGYFSPKPDKSKKPFTILMPPPNVTGVLHMGHVLNNTLQDILIRYKRMDGFNALWVPGTDHAGIATQNMVEKDLAKEGKNRFDLGREKLVERIWKWKEDKGGIILEQLKQLGCSCDWSRLRFTMDEGLSEAVKEVFIRLYEKGLIYKGKRIINWCPRCTTALANDEVEHEEEASKLYEVYYPLADGSGRVTIATTRPETMMADVAIAVNPNDERYKDLIGKEVVLPIVHKNIPIIADEYVDMSFGTGCLKITPAHDPNDFEIGQKHNLDFVSIIDECGNMTADAGKEFAGLSREEARDKVLEMLKDEGVFCSEKDYPHTVGKCYRCGTIIEPFLSDQWFVSMEPLAEPAIEKVKSGEIDFQPSRWTKVYLHWMENVRDWCISRQIWWGHRIPAYYCEDCGKLVVAKSVPDECSACGCKKFTQDEDVLDTWFSSALWPFSTLGWPEDSEDLQYYLPTGTLITAPEIIYLWVARMIMTTLEFKKVVPFDTVLLHGIVRDEIGQKMSKSLGNSPNPLDLIEQVGADALRFAIVYHTPKGEDSYYSDKILETGRNFTNKLWNATRYILQGIEQSPSKNNLQLELADKWILGRFNQVLELVRYNYEKLRFNDVAASMLDFVWKEFCSWYLELSKERIYGQVATRKNTAQFVLLQIMQGSMRMLHPIMPFITEEIFERIRPFMSDDLEESITISEFPKVDNSLIDEAIIKGMSLIQGSITTIRNLKKQVNLSPGKEVKVYIKVSENEKVSLFEEYKQYLQSLANCSELVVAVDMEKPAHSIAGVMEGVEIYLPLAGMVDLQAEREKLQKQLVKLEKEFKVISGKLNNEKFVNSAPAEIVAKEKEKYDEVKGKMDKVEELLQGLE